ncbi:TPA: hypothetical protein ACKP1B_001231, partial [Serratia fonticola]
MTIKKTLLASVITLTMISGMAHADSIAGAMTELEAITPNMSQAEINQKIERFIERAPKGTSIANVLLDFPLAHYVPVATQPVQETPHLDSNATDTERQAAQQAAEKIAAYRHNNPEGIPTHQIGAATHLDGEHQAPVTPHLDAPVIDRSSHLDSNATDTERQAAQQAAENMLAYRHNNPEGIPTHQIGAATHLDGEHQAPVTPHLDTPVIDRSSHLDSNATDAERQAAQQAAENMLAYRHNNPEGIPTHQIGAATHLDGEHQAPVTPHLDAPVIDRSSHLDSNVTDAERQAAQQAAEKIAAYRHNNPEGIPTHQIGAAT